MVIFIIGAKELHNEKIRNKNLINTERYKKRN